MHVVRALFRMVKGLPEFARSTMRLSEATRAVRQAFLNARSPERFLFMELPAALGVEPFEEGRVNHKQIDDFFAALNRSLQEWNSVTPLVVNTARETLLQACGFSPDPAGWSELQDKAREAGARSDTPDPAPVRPTSSDVQWRSE